MGKSLKNVVTPDDMSEAYGADTFRFYEMSMGPLDVSRPWATKDVVGAQRFLQRMWRLVVDETTGELRVSSSDSATATEADLKQLHRTIAGVREDYAELRFNTAGAKLIEFNNYLTKTYGADQETPRELAEALVLMLAPMAPHIAEELWKRLGHADSLVHGPFPVVDEKYLVEDTVEYPIQVNGKVRSRVTVATGASKDEVQATALADEKIVALVAGGTPRKIIVIPGKLVNIVL
jgi:leucyl-tRNA synthetase